MTDPNAATFDPVGSRLTVLGSESADIHCLESLHWSIPLRTADDAGDFELEVTDHLRSLSAS